LAISILETHPDEGDAKNTLLKKLEKNLNWKTCDEYSKIHQQASELEFIGEIHHFIIHFC